MVNDTPTTRTFVRRRGTTVVPNATVYDEALSYTALGVLLVLLSRPDAAPKGYRTLIGRGLGEKAVRNALRELDAAGYRHQLRRRHHGRFVTDTLVSEDRISRDDAVAYLTHVAPLPDDAANGGADRAAAYAARRDLQEHPESARRTVQRSGVARSRVPRSLTASLRAKETSLRSVSRDTNRANTNTNTNTDDSFAPCPPTPEFIAARDELRSKLGRHRDR